MELTPNAIEATLFSAIAIATASSLKISCLMTAFLVLITATANTIQTELFLLVIASVCRACGTVSLTIGGHLIAVAASLNDVTIEFGVTVSGLIRTTLRLNVCGLETGTVLASASFAHDTFQSHGFSEQFTVTVVAVTHGTVLSLVCSCCTGIDIYCI